jgi:hypothetical protein
VSAGEEELQNDKITRGAGHDTMERRISVTETKMNTGQDKIQNSISTVRSRQIEFEEKKGVTAVVEQRTTNLSDEFAVNYQ